MLQQHLAQVDRQPTTTDTTAAAAAGKDGDGQTSSSSSRSRASLKTGAMHGRQQQQQQQQQRAGTLTNKLLHHQSKLQQALTSSTSKTTAAASYSGGLEEAATQSLAAGIESGGGAALMSNFAALATGGNRQLSAALPTDSSGQIINPNSPLEYYVSISAPFAVLYGTLLVYVELINVYRFIFKFYFRLVTFAVYISGSAFVLVSEITIRRARLVLGGLF